METAVIGLDVGFGSAKTWRDGRGEIITSAVAPVRDSYFDPAATDGRMDTTRGKFVVGDLALGMLDHAGRRDSQWIGTDVWYAVAMAALSQSVKDGETVRVVAGLPLDDYHSMRDVATDALRGEHRVTYGDFDGRFTVSDVGIVPQAYGIAAAMSADGLPMRTIRVGIADLGSNKVNLLTLNALREDSAWSRTYAGGVLELANRVAQMVYETYPGLNPSVREVARWFVHGSFTYRGQVVPLAGMIKESVSDWARQIVSMLHETWPQPGRLDYVCLEGGGALLAGDKIKALLESEDLWPTIFCARDVFRNARGFCAWGRDPRYWR